MSAPITDLFNAWQRGDDAAGAQLFHDNYPALKELVRSQLRRNGGARSLQTTEYISEVYLELERQQQVHAIGRAQFYGIVATIVRRLVIDHYRAAQAQRRFGGQQRVSFELLNDVAAEDANADYWITLDRCVDELRTQDPLASRIVELRFLLGMSIEEAAHALETSPSTVTRSFRFARGWINSRMQPGYALAP